MPSSRCASKMPEQGAGCLLQTDGSCVGSHRLQDRRDPICPLDGGVPVPLRVALALAAVGTGAQGPAGVDDQSVIVRVALHGIDDDTDSSALDDILHAAWGMPSKAARALQITSGLFL